MTKQCKRKKQQTPNVYQHQDIIVCNANARYEIIKFKTIKVSKCSLVSYELHHF